MLRLAVLIAAAAMTVVGLLLLLLGQRSALPIAGWGGALLVAVLIERWRYQPAVTSDGQSWTKTDERFIDPETGRPMEVFYDARTGERQYRDAS